MGNEDIPVEKIVDLYQAIRRCRRHLLESEVALLYVMKRDDHPAVYEFQRIVSELLLLAAAVESRGRAGHGDDTWEDAARRASV